MLVGATTAGQAAPYVEIFSMARGAAAVIFATIDARPDIDVDAEGGEDPGEGGGGVGRIEFREVHFSYPSRRSVKVRREQGGPILYKYGYRKSGDWPLSSAW